MVSDEGRIREFVAGKYDPSNEKTHLIERHILNLWSQFSSLADSNFVGELCNGSDNTFYQRYWEMSLGCRFLDLGLEVKSANLGPDFELSVDGKTVWVEAIAPDIGSGKNKVPELIYGQVRSVPSNEILLRWTAAIEEKANRRVSYLESGVIDECDPFLIAINSSLLGPSGFHGISQYPCALEAVYPVGPQQVSFSKETLEVVSSDLQFRPKIKNVNGAEVATHRFLQPEYSGISGLIASNEKPYDPPLNGQMPLIVVHNQNAHAPIRSEILGADIEYSVVRIGKTDTYQIIETES